jgi:ankyrin repeat protein
VVKRFVLLPVALAVVFSSCQKSAPDAARLELERQKVSVSARDGVEAARAGNLERIQLLREAGLDLSLANEAGETPLQAALAAGHADVVDNLVRGGAVLTSLPPAMQNDHGRGGDKKSPSPSAPLLAGAEVDRVLQGAAQAELQDPEAQSALAWALARKDIATLKLLLAHGADPNQLLRTPASADFIEAVADEHFAYYLRKEKNVTPLMLAASTGQLDAARLLLDAGALPNATTSRHKTAAIWLAGKNQHVGIVQLLLGKDPSPESQAVKVRVYLGRQKATIYRDGAPVDSAPISSGRKDFPTPKGAYVVTNKYRDWTSTIYEDASMPFFMRLSCGDFGLHAGKLPGYPASHGCIRLPYDKAKAFFSKVEVGTLVEIVD